MFDEPASQEKQREQVSSRSGPGGAPRRAVAWVTDAVLARMVAAGLGLEALCFYLSLSRIELLDRVADLGLPCPPDRRLRRSKQTGWTPEDIRQLAELWALGVRAHVIADVLGRSVGAVYGQRRRFGLPTRSRRGLATLKKSDIEFRKNEVKSVAEAHGQVWPRPVRPSRQLELPLPDHECGIANETAGTADQGQIEVVPPKDPVLVEAIGRLDEMWRVGRIENRSTRKQDEVTMELALRALAEQHPRAIGEAMDMSYSAVVNRVSRLGISQFDRHLVDEFEVSKAFEFLARYNLEPRTCKGLKRLFFAVKGTGSFFCPEWGKKSEAKKRERREAGVNREPRGKAARGRNAWEIELAHQRKGLRAEAEKRFSAQWDLFEQELDESIAQQ